MGMYWHIYLPSSYLFFHLSIYLYIRPFLIELVTKVKPNINSIEVHPQLSNNEHPMDDVLVYVVSFIVAHHKPIKTLNK
jgi:hypothetical protein